MLQKNQWEHEKTFVAYEKTMPPNTATVLLVSAFVFLFRQNNPCAVLIQNVNKPFLFYTMFDSDENHKYKVS